MGEENMGGGALLRLIHNCYFKAGLLLPIQPEAFRPTDDDNDGLSVYIEGEATPEQALLGVAADKRNRYYIARIPVHALQQLGLSVQASANCGRPRSRRHSRTEYASVSAE
jgi:hypothetical protein